MPSLHHFDPRDTSPDLLINRSEELETLEEAFTSYFDEIGSLRLGPDAQCVRSLTGEKGCGKSILAAKLVKKLRKKYSADTLFVAVDCRGIGGVRGVLGSIASGLVSEIAEIAEIAEIEPAIRALAWILSTVTHVDTASIKNLNQQILQHKSAFKSALKGQGSLKALKTLSAEFDISFERTETEIKTLQAETTVTFDTDRLLNLTLNVFEAIRKANYRVFLLIDNLDELQHEYGTEEELTATAKTINRILRLCEAPIAMLFCMRSYFFHGQVSRVLTQPRVQLKRLSAEDHGAIVADRVAREREVVRNLFQTDDARNMVAELAERAATPFALLSWIQFVAQSRGGFSVPVAVHAKDWRDDRFVDFATAIEDTLKLFGEKGTGSVGRKELLKALGDDEDALRYLTTTELVLPRNLWDPTHFVLDPSAAWIAGL
jgi:Cdc6-like AAA superfamily ATPase